MNLKLKNYKKSLIKRNVLAKNYFQNLKEVKEIELFKLNKKNYHSFHQFVVRTNKRDQLQSFLKSKGVETMIHYPYMLNELNFFKNKLKLKKSDKLGQKILSLPISEEHKLSEIKYISNLIKMFFKKTN